MAGAEALAAAHPEEVVEEAGAAHPAGGAEGGATAASQVDAEFAQDVAEVGVAKDVLLAEALLEAGGAEGVVLFALLLVGEDRVGLADLLELLFRLFIALVAVRMVFQRQLAVRLLDLVGRGSLADAKLFIVIHRRLHCPEPFRFLRRCGSFHVFWMR